MHRLVAVSVSLAILLVGSTAAAETARGEPEPDAAGTVAGEVGMHRTYDVGLCARACIVGRRLGRDRAGPDSSAPMAEPDYYRAEVRHRSGAFEADGVAAGSYRIAVRGDVYRDEERWEVGYLQRGAAGSFTVVETFGRGTPFTVAEAETVDLGRLPFLRQVDGKVSYTDGMLSILGDTWASTRLKARGIPRGARVTVTSHGCGKQRTRTVVERSGDYRFGWDDPNANRHYRRTLQLRAVVSRPGYASRTFSIASWNVASYRWRCD